MLEESHGEGLIESEDHELLTAALEFLDRRTDSVMVPRDRVVWVSRLTPVAEVEEAMRVSGHSRILVSRSGLDDVIGFVHAKDLLRLEIAARGRPIPASVIRPVLAVATTSELGGVLLAMRRARRHVAIVRDTQRDTVGMITLEDVLEVIVGAISDETDRTQVVAEEQR
jgi:putative hemolysin